MKSNASKTVTIKIRRVTYTRLKRLVAAVRKSGWSCVGGVREDSASLSSVVDAAVVDYLADYLSRR
jgi:hypothetical protein